MIIVLFIILSITVFADKCNTTYLRNKTMAAYHMNEGTVPLVDELRHVNLTRGITNGTAPGKWRNGTEFEYANGDRIRSTNTDRFSNLSMWTVDFWHYEESTFSTLVQRLASYSSDNACNITGYMLNFTGTSGYVNISARVDYSSPSKKMWIPRNTILWIWKTTLWVWRT
jgi:hypothetical protein